MKKSSVQNRLTLMCGSFIIMIVAGACATGPPIDAGVSSVALPFEKAVGSLAKEMIDVVRDNQGAFEGPALVVLEPFRDQDTGEVLNASRTIEMIFTKSASKENDVTVRRLDRASFGNAEYFIAGAIKRVETSGEEASGTRQYQISARLYELSTEKKLYKTVVLAEGDNLDFSPSSLYEDSPVFFRDWQKDRGASKANLQHRDSFSTLDMNARAILAEAETAYDTGRYEIAMALFKEAAEQDNQRALPFYAGMYATSMKMGRMGEAESAFDNIVRLSVEQHGVLTVKFLFKVNATDFFGGEEQRRIYNMWLRQIGRYFQETNRCMKIAGHTSRTGPESWNDELSLRRAQTIQRLLKKTFKNVERRSKAVGRGFRDNVIGIATDDARDVLDRRVEIIPVGCGDI